MHTSLIHLKHQEHITTSRQPCRSNVSISTTDAEGERCTCLDYNFSQQNLAFTWTKCTPPKSPQFAGSLISLPRASKVSRERHTLACPAPPGSQRDSAIGTKNSNYLADHAQILTLWLLRPHSEQPPVHPAT